MKLTIRAEVVAGQRGSLIATSEDSSAQVGPGREGSPWQLDARVQRELVSFAQAVLLRHHFRSKDTLFDAVISESLGEFDVLQGEQSPRAADDLVFFTMGL